MKKPQLKTNNKSQKTVTLTLSSKLLYAVIVLLALICTLNLMYLNSISDQLKYTGRIVDSQNNASYTAFKRLNFCYDNNIQPCTDTAIQQKNEQLDESSRYVEVPRFMTWPVTSNL